MSTATFIPAPNPAAALIATLLGLVGALILVRLRNRLIGTTLTAAWWWAAGALGVVVASTVAKQSATASGEPLYFAAAVTTFCPLMAVLGAKRPQNRVWQWIVLSFWVVLSLPVGEWLLRGTVAEVHPARSWFLAILILVGVANYVPTRYALASLLFAAAQLVLLAPHLPWPGSTIPREPNAALGLLVSALAAAACSPRSLAAAEGEPLEHLWRDFRDLFGTLWALRVAERINAVSAMNGWPVTLHWSGFCCSGDDSTGPAEPSMRAGVRGPLTDNLRSLLRRFVSPEWIAERLDRPPGSDFVQ